MKAASRLVLGLLPPLQSGLQTLAQAGQQSRFIEQYLGAYSRAFAAVFYFSYFNESLAAYTNNSEVLAKVILQPGQPGRFYTAQLPFRWPKEMQQCQVLRVFQITGTVPAAIARTRWGIPFAATYGYRYAEFARKEGRPGRAVWLWLLEQIGLRTADAIIVTTEPLREHAGRYRPAEGIYLIPNSVDTERFHLAEQRPGGRTVIFVGRLEPQKNLFMLMEALARIKPTPRLIIAGDGSLREELLQVAGRLGVNLDWRRVVDNESLPAVLGEADVFVLPSLIEGHSKAALEAMSCGLPCVALDVPGTRDAIQHEVTGLLVPPTAEGLAAGLTRLLDNPEMAKRLGQAGRQWIEQHYSAEQVMQREIELLYQLAGRRRAR